MWPLVYLAPLSPSFLLKGHPYLSGIALAASVQGSELVWL